MGERWLIFSGLAASPLIIAALTIIVRRIRRWEPEGLSEQEWPTGL